MIDCILGAIMIVGVVCTAVMILAFIGVIIIAAALRVEELYSDWKEKKRMKTIKNIAKRIDTE